MPKSSKKNVTHNDVKTEIALLAKTFVAALREYKDSPAIRKALQDAVADLRSAGRGLAESLEKTRRSPANARLEATVKHAVTGGRAKAEASLGKYRRSLVSGLRNISQRIDDLADRLKTKKG
jgi:hypothetical protein